MTAGYNLEESKDKLIKINVHNPEAHLPSPTDDCLELVILAFLKARSKYGYDSTITPKMILEDPYVTASSFHENFPGSVDGLKSYVQRVLLEKVEQAVMKEGRDLPKKIELIYKTLFTGDNSWYIGKAQYRIRNMNLLTRFAAYELQIETWEIIMKPLRPAIEEYLQIHAPGWSHATTIGKEEEYIVFAGHFCRVVRLLAEVNNNQCDETARKQCFEDCVDMFLKRMLSSVLSDLGDEFHHDTCLTRVLSHIDKNKLSPE